MSGFVVYALPRSRTAWLSRFLTYGEWACSHEEMRHVRSLDDVRSWFAQPFTGTTETAAAPWWRMVPQGVRTVVVRRPVADVMDSLIRLGLSFDVPMMTREMQRLDMKLAQIAARVPGCLSVSFADLEREETCAAVFEHCLQQPHDPAWWEAMAPLNIQEQIPPLIRYFEAHKVQLNKVRQTARQVSMARLHRGAGHMPDGVTISEEPFDAYFPGALPEITRHTIGIGEGAAYPNSMNFDAMRAHAEAGLLQTVIARSNGKVFGYLLTILQPCFDDKRIIAAHHTTLWADDAVPLLGLRMMRAANDMLRDKGVGEIVMRAGIRGDGPRLGKMYRRLGAEECGELWRLKTDAA